MQVPAVLLLAMSSCERMRSRRMRGRAKPGGHAPQRSKCRTGALQRREVARADFACKIVNRRRRLLRWGAAAIPVLPRFVVRTSGSVEPTYQATAQVIWLGAVAAWPLVARSGSPRGSWSTADHDKLRNLPHTTGNIHTARSIGKSIWSLPRYPTRHGAHLARGR